MAFSFGAWLGRGPAMCEIVWVGVRGGEQFAWAAFRGVGGPLGRVGVPRGAGLLSAAVCGLSSVGGGEGCPASGCVAGVCWCSGGWGRPGGARDGERVWVSG